MQKVCAPCRALIYQSSKQPERAALLEPLGLPKVSKESRIDSVVIYKIYVDF